MYQNFYDCIYDLETVLGISSLDDMERVGVKFARECGFPNVAKYFEENAKKLRWHIKKEFEDAGYADITSGGISTD